MAINTSLLIAAPMLQDYLVDNATGLPLANGTITLYQDNSRTTFKNWYYQSGSPGAYTYITLPNPMTLSGIGTIVDNNGNDTIPFFYPVSEVDNTTTQTYYIVVTNSNGQQQFVRQNFPFVPTMAQNVTNPTLENVLVNGEFWRNIGNTPEASTTLTNVTDMVIAPDQHNGFSMPDIRFQKSTTGGVDTLTFKKFASGDPAGQVLQNDITPEYYLNLMCTGIKTGETYKYVQIPISLHIKTLESVDATLVIHAQNVGGGSGNQITIKINQFLGTGAAVNPPITIETITLTSAWTKYLVHFTFPSAGGLTVGGGGDDALYLQIVFPLSATFNINIAKPQLYLSNDVPTNAFQTYSEVNTIIDSPRTGDFKTSMSTIAPLDWVPCNNGSIGSAGSPASTRANIDTWPLYNLLWTNVNNAFASVGGGRGASAIDDFNANKAMVLPQALGQALLGIPPSGTFTYDHTTGFLTVNNAGIFYDGSPVILSNSGGALPAAFTAGTIYYSIHINATTIQLASSYANALNGTPVAFGADNGSGTNTISFALAGLLGEPRHVQLVAELAAHTHTLTGVNGATSTPAFVSALGTNTPSSDNIPIGLTGSNAPFNVVQPSMYVNLFLKL